MSLPQQYRKSLRERWSMRFKTSIPGDDCYDGIVTHDRKRFIVLREQEYFAFDGVLVLPKKFVRGYRDGAFERCTNEIIRSNGALEGLAVFEWLDEVETLRELFVALKEHDVWPGVEALVEDGASSALWIGPVTDVGRSTFELYGYDAEGSWERVYTLQFRDVCRVLVGDAYTREFNRYMRAKTESEFDQVTP